LLKAFLVVCLFRVADTRSHDIHGISFIVLIWSVKPVATVETSVSSASAFQVIEVASEDYTGDVMPLWQYASMNTSSQMNKAIPLLMGMNQTLGDMNG
jgi:hypothetical protein